MPSRRTFIAGGTAGLAAVSAAGPTSAQGQARPAMPAHPFEMPRNMTLLTFQRDGKHLLGVKTAADGLPTPGRSRAARPSCWKEACAFPQSSPGRRASLLGMSASR